MSAPEHPISVKPLTAELLTDLHAVFGVTATTRGCYCMWFILPAKECRAGWAGGNRTRFEQLTRVEKDPMGLLAYAGEEPVGWCAIGPRTRYARALRSPILRQHDPAEDDRVWLVPCFFIRAGFRRQGIMRELLTQAVALAAAHGASAVEGFPLAGEKRRGSGEAYVGVEPLFATCGFAAVDRPTPARVVMRLDLARPGRRRRAGAGRTQLPSEE
jgi:GNAT superfamily N-acetyltransferase